MQTSEASSYSATTHTTTPAQTSNPINAEPFLCSLQLVARS